MEVGSLVECVKNPSSEDCMRHIIMFGAIYPSTRTIYSVRMIRRNHLNTTNLLLLDEIDNTHLIPFTVSKREPGFAIKFFRELLPPMESEIKELLEQPELVQ
ncbi:MAG: hypothetical protein JWQ66_2928 [Mucilaginibacter sp.]|nr:hypothetical protein [Mucilaginibacter sp.]